MKIQKFSDLNIKSIDYNQYESDLKNELEYLINHCSSTNTKNESLFQDFFERFPSAILGALSGTSHYHKIFGHLVISQPHLKDYSGDRKPDFLVVTWNSLELYFNFIEIEIPNKKFFSGDKVEYHSDFNHALGQLKQWKTNKKSLEECISYLKENLFGGNFDIQRKSDKINYVLLYGMSDELTGSSSNRQRNMLSDDIQPPFYICTYSRLLKNLFLPGGMFSVKRNSGTDTFDAIGITPFKAYGTSEWSDFHNVTRKEKTIASCKYLSDTEKSELLAEIKNLDSKSLKEIIKIQLDEPGTDLSDDVIW